MSFPPDIADWVRSALPGVQAVYLFGSRAAGSSNADSDWDIALLGPQRLQPTERWHLQESLAAHLGTNVDLVDLRSASAVMKVQVLGGGTLLYEADRSARQLFEALALSDYARLNEERRDLLADVQARGRVYA